MQSVSDQAEAMQGVLNGCPCLADGWLGHCWRRIVTGSSPEGTGGMPVVGGITGPSAGAGGRVLGGTPALGGSMGGVAPGVGGVTAGGWLTTGGSTGGEAPGVVGGTPTGGSTGGAVGTANVYFKLFRLW